MRIYCETAELGGEVKLTKEQQRHMKVLRLKPGEPLYVFDGRGNEYEGQYESKVRDRLILKKKVQPRKEHHSRITIAIAPAKGYRMDFLIEKATEIGVNEIILTINERSIVKPSQSKINRWRKIAIEACCQSGRATVPTLTGLISFGKAIEKVSDYDSACICTIDGGDEKIDGSTILFIGPEGGFTEKEMQLASNKGIKSLKLANTVLRTETAGIVAAAKAIPVSK